MSQIKVSAVETSNEEDCPERSLLGRLLEDNISLLPELTFLHLENDNHTPDDLLAFLKVRTPGYRPRATGTFESSTSLSASRSFEGLNISGNTFDRASWS